MLLGHAAALWGGALVCVVAIARWRLPRHLSGWHALAFLSWVTPTVVLSVWAPMHGRALPGAALVLGAFAIAVAALMAPRLALCTARRPSSPASLRCSFSRSSCPRS